MQIVFGTETADSLRDRYTVLELETVEKDGVQIDAYCLVPSESIKLQDLPKISKVIELHEAFVQANKDNNRELCKILSKQLIGEFSGELDSFYEEICNRS